MNITVTIDQAVASAGIQTIAVALGLKNVTDEEARLALANRFRDETARLYVQGDKMMRETTANATAEGAAASYITVS